MTLQEQLEALRQSIKTALADSSKLIGESKFDEAKVKQDEAKKLRAQAETIKAQIEAEGDVANDALKVENDALRAQVAAQAAAAAVPVRPAFVMEPATPATPAAETDGIKSFIALKYGEPDAAVKAVLSDLYGFGDKYNQLRWDFWHIPGKINTHADSLSRRGTRRIETEAIGPVIECLRRGLGVCPADSVGGGKRWRRLANINLIQAPQEQC